MSRPPGAPDRDKTEERFLTAPSVFSTTAGVILTTLRRRKEKHKGVLKQIALALRYCFRVSVGIVRTFAFKFFVACPPLHAVFVCAGHETFVGVFGILYFRMGNRNLFPVRHSVLTDEREIGFAVFGVKSNLISKTSRKLRYYKKNKKVCQGDSAKKKRVGGTSPARCRVPRLCSVFVCWEGRFGGRYRRFSKGYV